MEETAGADWEADGAGGDGGCCCCCCLGHFEGGGWPLAETGEERFGELSVDEEMRILEEA